MRVKITIFMEGGIMKRVLDFIFSTLFLLVFSPLFLLISLSIKLNSKGPVFFTQKRIGKNNKEFLLYKFRTMKVGTPNVATELLTERNDYITKVGRFLRKSSMDELPQLLNILKGDMSFVGPRPALYNQYQLTEMRTEAGVHKLVPGLTGWAQINGRDILSDECKVTFDKYYLDNRSLLFDTKIIIRTAFKVLRAEGVIEIGDKSAVAKEKRESA
jgi:O-antigen biosynthesis protein WbqP